MPPLAGPPDEPDSQGAFYLRSGPRPETLLFFLRRCERRILDIGPELDQSQCLRLLSEAALFDTLLDKIEADVKRSPHYRARQEFEASALLESIKKSVAERAEDRPIARRRKA